MGEGIPVGGAVGVLGGAAPADHRYLLAGVRLSACRQKQRADRDREKTERSHAKARQSSGDHETFTNASGCRFAGSLSALTTSESPPSSVTRTRTWSPWKVISRTCASKTLTPSPSSLHPRSVMRSGRI